GPGPDVAVQVEAVGDGLDVAQDLGLAGVAVRPLPLLLQLGGEGIGVVDALHVAAGPGVAVPEPGAADAGARLEDARPQAEPAQPVQHVQAGEPGPDDQGVQGGGGGGRRGADVRHVPASVAGWGWVPTLRAVSDQSVAWVNGPRWRPGCSEICSEIGRAHV